MKIPFLYFLLHKSWIWQTLGHVMDIFLITIFITHRKNTFGQIFFQISCTGSKMPLWQNWKIAKMAFLKPCMKFEIFLTKIIFLKHYENGNKKKYPWHAPGSAKSRIYAVKSTKRGFSKKALTGIEIFFLF